MTERNHFYYLYASLTNAQFPLLKVAALCFDKLVILDLVGASSATSIGACYRSWETLKWLQTVIILAGDAGGCEAPGRKERTDSDNTRPREAKSIGDLSWRGLKRMYLTT